MNFNISKDALTDNKAVGFFKGFLNQNSPTLALIGGLGLMATGFVMAFKASKSVVKIKEEFDRDVAKLASEGQEMAVNSEKMKELKTHRNISYVLAYRWVILFGAGAVGLTCLSLYLKGAQFAGLAALAAWKQDELKAFAKNAKEMIGEEKFKELENKTLEEMVMDNFMGKDGGLALRPAESMGDFFVDTCQGIMFQMREDELLEALQKAKLESERNHGLSEVKYLEGYLGVEAPERAIHYWGPNRPFEARLGERQMFGCTIRTIEYKHAPTGGKDAGIPGFNK